MTDIQRKSFETPVHGTYLLRRPVATDTPELPVALVGFHGYGETATEMMQAMERIPGSERWFLCSVQALHPFYRKTGEVVASWMTGFDRDNAIHDNVRYVSAVVGTLRERHGIARFAYVGFSQGVAMAYRAAALGGHWSHALVALAGDVPPDVAEAHPPNFPPVLIGRGSEETWYTEDQLVSDVAKLEKMGVEARAAHFEGGHEWTEEFLTEAGTFLKQHLEPPSD